MRNIILQIGAIVVMVFFFGACSGDDSSVIPDQPEEETQAPEEVSKTPGELDNDTLHIKLDLSRGGAISYISISGTSRNLVNIHDEGRYVQQSYYAGYGIDRQDEGQNSGWTPWPWNPIQVGDSYGNRAEILKSTQEGNTLYVKCIPMLWDMRNEPAEAEMEQWTTLMGNIIKVHNKLTCHRTDNLFEEEVNRDQELPAVYLISSLKTLYAYLGKAPFTGAPLNKPEVIDITSDSMEKYFVDNTVSENWMAFVDDDLWGMAVYNPTCNNFLAGMFLDPGGEATDNPTSYISPIKKVILNKNSVFEYDYYLIIGKLDEIRAQIYILNKIADK